MTNNLYNTHDVPCAMLKKELQEIIVNGENSGVEFKRDDMPVPRTDISCLDPVRLENYLRDIINDPEIPTTLEEWETRLTRLGFLTQAGEVICCTVAGLVLFGFHLRRYLKQAGIRVFTFPGQDKEYKALLDEILDGPLVGTSDQPGWFTRAC